MDSKSRVIVITGANRGIGFEAAKRLLKNPSKPIVVITSRNESLGQAAVRELLNQYPSSKDYIFYHVLDITKKETYSPFADWIKKTFGRIDVLVNNAGIILADDFKYDPNYKSTLEEAEKVVGTNYLSTRAFTDYVLPLLASDGKIISVASTRGLFDWQGKAFTKKLLNPKFQPNEVDEVYDIFMNAVKKQDFQGGDITSSSYNISKGLVVAWTYHMLTESLKGDQQAFTMCPGWCRTDMGGEEAPRSAEEGSETIEYLIDLPYKLNKEINGKFFRDNKVIAFDESISTFLSLYSKGE